MTEQNSANSLIKNTPTRWLKLKKYWKIFAYVNSFIRPREISQIQIKNVDLENNVIHLFPEQTKNPAYRSAILSPELVDILTSIGYIVPLGGAV